MTLARILELMQQKGMKQGDFAKRLGLNPQAITNWKNGNTESYKKMLPEIAEILSTTVDYLIGNTDEKEKAPALSESDLTNEELELIRMFRSLSEESKNAIKNYISEIK